MPSIEREAAAGRRPAVRDLPTATLDSSTGRFRCWSRFDMKAKIVITPKQAVVDPQGKAVQNALEHMGYSGIHAVHVGKYLEIELNGADRETARKRLDEACHKFLSNPVIEDYKLEIE